jgi:proteasome assembly chaperone (PAC2) family protein
MAQELSAEPRFMTRARLWLKRGRDVRDPVVLVGFPGIGRIGELVTSYFLKTYPAELIGFITSPYFSTQTIVDRNGVAHILGIRIYKMKAEWINNDLLVVRGDQHQEIMGGEYESSETLLKYLKKRGASLVITIGGMYSSESDRGGVYVLASDQKIVQEFKRAGVLVAQAGVPIVGAAGIIIGLARMMGVPAACLLGETSGEKPDVEVSKRIVLLIGKFFGFQPNMEILNKEAEKVEKIMKIYEESYAKIMESPSISKIMSERRGPEYVS